MIKKMCRCGKRESRPNKVLCQFCADLNSLKIKKKKEEGFCTTCKKRKAVSMLASCSFCLEKHKENTVKRTIKYKQNNICNNCGKTSEGKNYCNACLQLISDKKKDRKKLNLCRNCKEAPLPNRVYCKKCQELRSVYRNKTKQKVFDAYGGAKCACCGEDMLAFLTLDHINNDGNKHRKEINRTYIYNWVVKNNFPPLFQVLCYNCNQGKRMNGGICPHKKREN